MKRYWKYIRPCWYAFLLGPLLMITEVVGEVFLPAFMAQIINVGAANHDVPYIIQMGTAMILTALLMMVGGIGGAWFGAKASVSFGADLRNDCFKKIQTFSFQDIDDFSTGSRKKEGVKLQITRNQILIIEGIHGLNPALHEGFDPGEICKFYLSELTCLNLDDHNRIRTTDARLLRRIVRDYQFRGTTPEKTLAMWDSVRAGEEKWIFPYQEQADIVFNTALHYELPVLKPIAYNMLSTITPDHPCYFRAHRLIRCLNYFLPAPEDTLNEIPPLSILREFIGGNTLYTAP